MEIQNISALKKGILAPETDGISETPYSEELFNDLGKIKIDALKQTVAEIKFLVEEREILSNTVLREAEKLKREIQTQIDTNEKNDVGGQDIAREKNDLRHKKMEIAELQLNEKISCWKDIALLKRESREYEKQLIEKEGRAEMFNKILEED